MSDVIVQALDWILLEPVQHWAQLQDSLGSKLQALQGQWKYLHG